MKSLQFLLITAVFSFTLFTGCSNNPVTNTNQQDEPGSASFTFVAAAASNFSQIADHAEVVVSGNGMATIKNTLTVTSTNVSGSIYTIQAGNNRKFEVFIYDTSNKICFYGEASADVYSGQNANISMTLYPRSTSDTGTVNGSATISGTIQGGTSNTPPIVAIQNPANYDTIFSTDTMQIRATASDNDGSISRVVFYDNYRLLATDYSYPYSCALGYPAAGTHEIRAVAIDDDNDSASTTITVTFVSGQMSRSYQINAGGSRVSPFSVDTNFSGGNTASTSSSISLSGVNNPAPHSVYQSERYGNITYTCNSLASGKNYLVRLHFAELYWNASGSRRFNVAINNTIVLSNFDIFATAGGAKKAIVREFTATAKSNGSIVINFSTITDNAQVCGIEVISQ